MAHRCVILTVGMTTPSEQEPDEPRLDSWKEIASFLGRGIRTVQRWEREDGLPVHRLPHAQRGSVFAHANELSAWWERRQINPEPATPSRTDSEARLGRVTITAAATSWP